MSDHGFMESDDTTLAMRDAFAGQTTEGASLMPSQSQLPAAMDSVIVAQKVETKRDTAQIIQRLKVLAGVAGDKYYYRFPVKNKGRQNWIEGPSIKLANDLAREYGNCQINVRAFDIGDSWMFYARFVDVETGYSLERAFQQRKGQQSIKTKDKGRAQDIVFQIGQSKAIRNVVVNALETFADYALEEAKGSIIEKIERDPERMRNNLKAMLERINVALVRVETQIGRKAEDWRPSDMARIMSQAHAIHDGMTTADEVWPMKAPTVDETEDTDQAPTSDDPVDEPKETKTAPKEDDTPAQSSEVDNTGPRIPTPSDPFNARDYDWEAFDSAFFKLFDQCDTADAVEELWANCAVQFDNMFPGDRTRYDDLKTEKLVEFESEEAESEPA